MVYRNIKDFIYVCLLVLLYKTTSLVVFRLLHCQNLNIHVQITLGGFIMGSNGQTDQF